jgi:DNA-binding transcriptional MerR regulator
MFGAATARGVTRMIVLHETGDAARVLGIADRRLRRLVDREIVRPTARTVRGTLLFADEDLERARKRLELERPQ